MPNFNKQGFPERARHIERAKQKRGRKALKRVRDAERGGHNFVEPKSVVATVGPSAQTLL